MLRLMAGPHGGEVVGYGLVVWTMTRCGVGTAACHDNGVCAQLRNWHSQRHADRHERGRDGGSELPDGHGAI